MTERHNNPSEVVPDSPAVYVDKLSFRYRSLDDETRTKPASNQPGTEPLSQPRAIEDISFSLPAGKLMLIAGPSGCGKTTLLKCLNGLIPNSYKGTLSGEIQLNGRSIKGSSLRFLPTTVRDFVTTLDAQRARGFEIDKLRGGLFGKVARLAPMIVPVVIGSIVGAGDIINAMELRCFGVGKRTWLIELHTRQVDRAILTLALAGFAAVTLLNILGIFFTTGPLHILHSQGIPPFLLR
jgi:ABC transporter